jgi:hypothetical protein
MLFFNSKRIDVNDNTPQAKEFKTWCNSEWDKLPDPVIFRRNKPDKINPTGNVEPMDGYSVLLESNFNGEFGSETWRYTEYAPTTNANTGNLEFFDKRMHFGRNRVINKNRKDLLFYLLVKCSDVLDGTIILEDREKASRDKAQSEILETKIKSFIYLSEDDTKLVEMAKLWGVDETKSIFEIKNSLFAAIRNVEKSYGDGYSKFLTQITPEKEALVVPVEIKKKGMPKGGWPKKDQIIT